MQHNGNNVTNNAPLMRQQPCHRNKRRISLWHTPLLTLLPSMFLIRIYLKNSVWTVKILKLKLMIQYQYYYYLFIIQKRTPV